MDPLPGITDMDDRLSYGRHDAFPGSLNMAIYTDVNLIFILSYIIYITNYIVLQIFKF
mgnify:FL=1